MTTITRPARRRLLLAMLALLVLATGGLAAALPDEGPPPATAPVAPDAAATDEHADAAAGSEGTRPTRSTTTTTPPSTATPSERADAGEGLDDDDDDFPGLPEDDEDPGPWIPPTSVDDFAPNPLVLDLVAETPPEDPPLGPGGQQAVGGVSSGVVQCDGRCIERATVEPGGTSATFAVHTTVPARIWVVLDSPAVQDSSSRVQDWEVAFDGLEPDTRYHVTLVAEDQHGNLEHRYGSFRTLARRVTIEFTSIDVVDDADKPGKGEIEWFFGLGGTWIDDWHRGVGKIKGGRSIHLDGRRTVIEDAGPTLELAVQGIEHDKGKCFAGTGPFEGSGGDVTGCRDYATAVEVFDLDALVDESPVMPTGGHDAVFLLRTRAHYLDFDVYGTIDVDYG